MGKNIFAYQSLSVDEHWGGVVVTGGAILPSKDFKAFVRALAVYYCKKEREHKEHKESERVLAEIEMEIEEKGDGIR